MYKDCQLCKSTGYLPYCNENMSDSICPSCEGQGIVLDPDELNRVNREIAKYINLHSWIWRLFDVGLLIALSILLTNLILKYWR